MAKVRISDVAREAGVALGTVSNALNHPEKVKPETLELINDTIARLGFLPNQSARQLAGGTSKTFGLVLPRLDHGISLQIANGAHAEARAHGYDVLIANADNDDILQDRYLRYFLGGQMAGVMVQPMADAGWEAPAQLSALPTVFLNVHAEGKGHFVMADNTAEGKLIAEHALECNARHVCVIGKAEFSQLALRIAAIDETLKYSGVQLEIINEGSWNTAEDGEHLGRELASRPKAERPDFIIGLTDVLAAGAIAGIEEEGLKVPDDIKVAGCDGNPLAWGGALPLTTCVSSGAEIGRRGVQTLLEFIENDDAPESSQFTVPTTLLKRASTGAPVKTSAENKIALAANLGAYLN